MSYQNGSGGYDYAVHLLGGGAGTLLYQVYSLTSSTTLKSMVGDGFKTTLEPLSLDVSTATPLFSGSSTITSVLDSGMSALTGIPNHDWSGGGPYSIFASVPNRLNYVVPLNVASIIGNAGPFMIFVGQSSGRDTLSGVETPEVSTWAVGGVLVCCRRRHGL